MRIFSTKQGPWLPGPLFVLIVPFQFPILGEVRTFCGTLLSTLDGPPCSVLPQPATQLSLQGSETEQSYQVPGLSCLGMTPPSWEDTQACRCRLVVFPALRIFLTAILFSLSLVSPCREKSWSPIRTFGAAIDSLIQWAAVTTY